jgi:hypothetical protein
VEPLDTNIYSRALAEARNELLHVQYEIEQLSKRKQHLEALIANLSPLLPQATPTLFPVAKTSPVASTLPSQPLWKLILLSINEKSRGFTVRDAIQGLERIGRPVESKNRFQIVRSAMKSKKDEFEQIGPGLYAVREKSNEKEVIPEEKTS